MFKPSEYIVPKSLDEAVRVLFEDGDRARIIAGGTMIYELAQRGMIPKVEKLVDISGLGLNKIERKEDGVHIGSSVVINELASNEALSDVGYEVVREGLSKVEPEQVRNVATVGGEICGSTPFFDLPPALIAADAKLKIIGPKGERTLPTENFFLDYLLTDLKRGELLREVFLPKPPPNTSSAFIKYSRTAFDYPVVNMGVRIAFDDGGKCLEARIGMCGIAGTPVRVRRIEEILIGKKLDENVVKSAVARIDEFQPPSRIHSSSTFKKHIAKIILRDGVMLVMRRRGLLV